MNSVISLATSYNAKYPITSPEYYLLDTIAGYLRIFITPEGVEESPFNSTLKIIIGTISSDILSITELLKKGFYKQSYVLWRVLLENIATFLVMQKQNVDIAIKYLEYGNYMNYIMSTEIFGDINNIKDEDTKKISLTMEKLVKKELKEAGLNDNQQNRKKLFSYGWLKLIDGESDMSVRALLEK